MPGTVVRTYPLGDFEVAVDIIPAEVCFSRGAATAAI